MPGRFQNKYRIPPARLQTWDYGSNASYFITICTKNREHFFGEIENGKMNFSGLGITVEQEWIKTPALRPDMNLQLGEYVVMPNHFHGILMIGDNRYNVNACRDAMHGVSTDNGGRGMNRDARHGGPTDNIGSGTNTDAMHGVSTPPANHFGPQSKNLASVIRGFKSAVTTCAKKNGILDFAWQARFHDHIIRDAESFERIQNYIANNPLNWKEDKYNC